MSLRVGDGTDRVGDVNTLGDMFYPLYERLFSEDSEFVRDLENKLAQSRMGDPVEMYLARAMGIGVLSGLLLWALGLILGWFVFMVLLEIETVIGFPVSNEALLSFIEMIRIPLMIIVTGIVFGAIGFAIGFGSLVAVPYSRASAREREINMLLTDAVSFMYALSVGGLDQLEILQAIAEADDTYGEVSKEFQSIVQETRYFDTDYKTAIRIQAIETPSDELSQFLTDMLSIVNSGGDMQSFLEDKKEKHMRTAKQQQELTLETLELFGEMYMTLSLFPLLLIIIMVIMQMMPDSSVSNTMLYSVVYGLVPMTGVGFMVLVATVKMDEPGDGYLSSPTELPLAYERDQGGLLNLGLVEKFTGERNIFDRIKNREGTHEAVEILRAPHIFFRDNPLYTMALTVPFSLLIVALALAIGSAPTSWTAMQDQPVWGTFLYVYIPLYLICIPLSIFREWNVRTRMGVTSKLSEDLRKLSSANDTGLTLLESLKAVSETTSGKLPREFEVMFTKVHFGTSLNRALLEFNNKYHIPRLARTVKLISKAQEASNQISNVLRTAAQASENHDDIERDRKSRTRMQIVIIIMTFLTMLAVIAILKVQFIDTMAGLADQSGGGGGGSAGGASGMGGQELMDVNTSMLSLLFFHAIVLQGIMSGFISGYMRSTALLSGLKYVIVLASIALVAWILVG